MRKRYRRLLALWSLAVFLLTGLLSGCGAGAGKQTDRRMPSAAVGETEGAERAVTGKEDGNAGTVDGGTDKAAQTAGGRTDRSTQAAGSETAEETTSEAENGKTGTVPEAAGSEEDTVLPEEDSLPEEDNLPEDGSYTSKEDVALYLYTYGHLPDNFIRKNDAEKLGWDNSKGNLAEVAPGKSIGGDRFGNYEGLLPEEDGRKWTECDIGYEDGYRTGERIVFSNDGLIYYTGDHYKSFERLY